MIRASEFDPRRQIVTTVSVRRASRCARPREPARRGGRSGRVRRAEFPRRSEQAAGERPALRQSMAPAEHRPARRHASRRRGRRRARGSSPAEAVRRTVIAIIDDGVDLDHPDLAPNIWTNPRRGARDRHGRDFVDDTDRWNPRPKVFNPPFDDTDSNDIHGTPCAGVAAAAGNNRQGVAGIAWGCKLLAVKILAGPTLAPYDRIADSIRYAAQHADVLSCSWGVARHPDVESALADATSRGRRGRGAPVFAATGNDFARHRVSVERRTRLRGRRVERSRAPIGLQQLRTRASPSSRRATMRAGRGSPRRTSISAPRDTRPAAPTATISAGPRRRRRSPPASRR